MLGNEKDIVNKLFMYNYLHLSSFVLGPPFSLIFLIGLAWLTANSIKPSANKVNNMYTPFYLAKHSLCSII